MSTTVNNKDIIDLPRWRPESPAIAATAAGMSMCYDKRNNITRDPNIYFLRGPTTFDKFNPINGDWLPLATPAIAPSVVAGATCIFNPSQGPRGTIAAGATASSFTLTTALPAAVGTNQLANRGDGLGYYIRMVFNTAAASGKVEERRIVANTSGTTPLIYVDSPFSTIPASGATYELLSGRVFLLGSGVSAAGTWKYYDIATNSYSANLSVTTLVSTVSIDSSIVALSESHVPYDRSPGEGFVLGTASSDTKNCIQATAASGTTITGSGMPTDLATNEYRNFQVRIVEDVTTPTAVGQRRRITSHTSGAAGVFTVPTFTVTPSAVAKFVVENDDDKILVTTSGAILIYNYNITANTWDTTTWAAPVANGAGTCFEQSFGISRDAGANARHSNLFRIRGGAVSSIDVLDIAGAATGSWSNAITYSNLSQTFTTGTIAAYDPYTQQGRLIHINPNGLNRMLRFDVKNRSMEPGTYIANLQGVALVGNKMAMGLFIDGAVKISQLYQLLQTSAQMISQTILK